MTAYWYCKDCNTTYTDLRIERKLGMPFCKVCHTGPLAFDGWELDAPKSATDPAAMYCGQCGAVIPTDTVKCSECGDVFREGA